MYVYIKLKSLVYLDISLRSYLGVQPLALCLSSWCIRVTNARLRSNFAVISYQCTQLHPRSDPILTKYLKCLYRAWVLFNQKGEKQKKKETPLLHFAPRQHAPCSINRCSKNVLLHVISVLTRRGKSVRKVFPGYSWLKVFVRYLFFSPRKVFHSPKE